MSRPVATDMVAAALAEALTRQPWWRRYAGTVTAVLAGVATMVPVIATAWADAPAWIVTILGAASVVVVALSERLTRNGLTPRGNADVEAIVDRLPTAQQVHTQIGQVIPLPSASAVWAEQIDRLRQ